MQCYYLQLLFQKRATAVVTEHETDNFFNLSTSSQMELDFKFRLIQADELHPMMPFFPGGGPVFEFNANLIKTCNF